MDDGDAGPRRRRAASSALAAPPSVDGYHYRNDSLLSDAAADSSVFSSAAAGLDTLEREEELMLASAVGGECLLKVLLPTGNGDERAWDYSIYLSSCDSVLDLKKQVANHAVRADPRAERAWFLKSWLRLPHSSVVLEDDHPAHLLALHRSGGDGRGGGDQEDLAYAALQKANAAAAGLDDAATAAAEQDEKEREAERAPGEVVEVWMDLFPQPASAPYPRKECWMMKRGGAPFRRWARVHVRLFRGRLTYGRTEADAGRKPIPLGRFALRSSSRNALEFEIVTPTRRYRLQALDAAQKDEWVKELRLLAASKAEDVVDAEQGQARRAHYCAYCEAPFGLRRRRNNCRECGFVFCSRHFVSASSLCHHCIRKQGGAVPGGEMDADIARAKQAADLVRLALEPRPPRAAGEARLEVHVIQAAGLVSSDRNGLSDPYAVVHFEGVEYRTRTVYMDLFPVWRQSFYMDCRGGDPLVWVAVFDYDKYKADDFLGMVVVPLYKLRSGVTYNRWYPLHARGGSFGRGDDGVRGEIQLQLRYEYDWRTYLRRCRPVPAGMPELPLAGEADAATVGRSRAPPRPTLRVKEITRSIKRLKAVAAGMHIEQAADTVRYILDWKSPATTLMCYFFYMAACFYMPSSMLPALLPAATLFALSTNYIQHKYFVGNLDLDGQNVLPPSLPRFGAGAARAAIEAARAKALEHGAKALEHGAKALERASTLVGAGDGAAGAGGGGGGGGAAGTSDGEANDLLSGSDGDSESDTDSDSDGDSDDDEDGGGGGGRRGKSGKKKRKAAAAEEEEGFAALKKQLLKVQLLLDTAASTAERLQSLFAWRDPLQTSMVALVLLAVTLLLAAIPFRVLLAAAGTGAFMARLLKLAKRNRDKGRRQLAARKDRHNLHSGDDGGEAEGEGGGGSSGGAAGDAKDGDGDGDDGNVALNFLQRIPLPWETAAAPRMMPRRIKKG